MHYQDSAGRGIQVGDMVKFRGKIYTIARFGNVQGNGAQEIHFEEKEIHTPEVATTWSVDLAGAA